MPLGGGGPQETKSPYPYADSLRKYDPTALNDFDQLNAGPQPWEQTSFDYDQPNTRMKGQFIQWKKEGTQPETSNAEPAKVPIQKINKLCRRVDREANMFYNSEWEEVIGDETYDSPIVIVGSPEGEAATALIDSGAQA